MRELLLGMAAAGAFVPLWSDRITEEWAGVAARADAAGRWGDRREGDERAGGRGKGDRREGGNEVLARGEIALANARHPGARVAPAPGIEAGLWLPDAGDLHVLASAIAGRACGIITLNLKDFPRRVLGEHGLEPRHPDSFLCALAQRDPARALHVALAVRDEAERLSGRAWPLRRLLKKARLPRFAACLARLGP